MTFKDWYEVHYSDTWEQREYRYFYTGIGDFAFKQAIPEYIEEYRKWCRDNCEEVIIDITY